MRLPADATVARSLAIAGLPGDGAAVGGFRRAATRWLGSLLFALPLIGLAGAGWWSLRGTRSMFAADMTRTITLLGAETSGILQTQQVMLAALNARTADLDWEQIRTWPDVLAFARALVASSGTVDTFGLTSPDGHIALATEAARPPVDVDLSDRDFVAAFPPGTARRDSYVAAPVQSRVDGRPQLHLSRPRVTADGRADGGTVVAGIDPAVFGRAFAAVAPSRKTHFLLLRRDGTVLASYPEGAAGKLPAFDPVAGRQVIESGSLLRGLRLTAVTTLHDWPLTLVEQGDPALLWRRWLAMMAFPALGAGAAMLLLGVLAVRMHRTAATEAARLFELARAAAAAHAALAERGAMEGRLREAEKSAALGQLSAGVAHDFNNLLQAILMGAESLQRHARNPDEVRGTGAMLIKAAERGVALTRRMLDFARRDEAGGCCAVADALRETADLLNRSLGGPHCVRLVLPPGDLPTLRSSKAEFETVVINLVLNARDAMPVGGEIVLTAGIVAEAPAPPSLCLTVADTGTGMDAGTLARAGEAFFTTKPPGKGTGLGLAMARGFAERAGGRLELASEPGRGTVVTLLLPAAP